MNFERKSNFGDSFFVEILSEGRIVDRREFKKEDVKDYLNGDNKISFISKNKDFEKFKNFIEKVLGIEPKIIPGFIDSVLIFEHGTLPIHHV